MVLQGINIINDKFRYLNASQHGKTDLAVENLHKFFDQNLRHLISLEKVLFFFFCIEEYKCIRPIQLQTKLAKPFST